MERRSLGAASRQGVSHSTAYVWLKQSREEGGSDAAKSGDEPVVFARAMPVERATSSGEIRVQVGTALVRVERGFEWCSLTKCLAMVGFRHATELLTGKLLDGNFLPLDRNNISNENTLAIGVVAGDHPWVRRRKRG